MNSMIDSLVMILLVYGIPAVLIIRSYIKMSEDERTSVKKMVKSPSFIFTIGFLGAGSILAAIGNALSFSTLKFVGLSLLVIGAIVTGISTWNSSKWKSMVITIILGATLVVWIMP